MSGQRIGDELEGMKKTIWKRLRSRLGRLRGTFHHLKRGRHGSATMAEPTINRRTPSPKNTSSPSPSSLILPHPSVPTLQQRWLQLHIVDPLVLSRRMSCDSLASAPAIAEHSLFPDNLDDIRPYAKSTTNLPAEDPQAWESLPSLPPPLRRPRFVAELPSKLKNPLKRPSRSRSVTPTSGKRLSASSSHKSGRSTRKAPSQGLPVHRPGSAFGMDNRWI
ncbi:hypothetical protein AAF712_011142 [Marasmius tenuissimus]|uniref:Uncharacterized protein n=1 Tax=Marasmius tenuissimus TaxID=585030 RepID=A0ABR2ZLE1_9AGAR